MERYVARALTRSALLAGMLGFAGAAWSQSEVKSPTLDAVKKRGEVICGVDTGIPGYAYQDASGKWQGLDVALCRAVAAATLGDPEKVKYIGTTSKVRFSVLQSGEIDLLVRDSELTLKRDSALGLVEVTPNFYTGQTIMVRKSLNVAHVKDLNGATVCLLTGTTLETNIADYNRANNIKIGTLLFERPDEMKKTSTDPQVKKFLGLEGDLGKGLGLDNDFGYKVVKAVGNYGEVYEATFGSKGLGLPRGLNNLYRNGGLMYPYSWY
jgi:general L-amino acid transport system substrate-binding protein